MTPTGIALLGALLFATACGARSSGKIKINVLRSDAAIRKQLLQLTPLGTSAQQVSQFLLTRLEHDKGTNVAGAPGQPFQSAMAVDLGHYGFFLFRKVVQAFWDFDEHDKLLNIRVRRFNTGP